MNIPTLALAPVEEDPNRPRVVVRVSTNCWSTSRGIYQQRNITWLRRQCQGHNFVQEDAWCASPEDTIRSIINLDTSPDGVYEIVMTNVSRDYEYGEIYGYDFKLVPYQPNDREPKTTWHKSLREYSPPA